MRLIQVVVMFHVTCLGWLLFRASSLSQARDLMQVLVFGPWGWSPAVRQGLLHLGFYKGLMLGVQWLQERHDDPCAPMRLPGWARVPIVVLLVESILLWGASGGRNSPTSSSDSGGTLLGLRTDYVAFLACVTAGSALAAWWSSRLVSPWRTITRILLVLLLIRLAALENPTEELLVKHYDPAYTRAIVNHYLRLPQAARFMLNAHTGDAIDRLAGQVVQLERLAAGGGKFDVRCRFVQHAGCDRLRL